MTYLLGRDDPVPRLRPSVASGVVVLLGAATLVVGLQFTSGFPYRVWGTSERALVLTEIVPFAVTAAFLVAFALWSQWDALWRDPFRLPTSALTRAVVALACAGVLVRLAFEDAAALPLRMLALLALSAALTGFVEELALRGVLLRALRVRRRPEVACALWTLLVSALVQVPLLALVPDATTAGDVLVALSLGALFYLVRRVTRSLWPAVAVHAAWDLGTLLERTAGEVGPDAASAGALGPWVAVVLALVVLGALAATLRGDRTRRALVDPLLS